MKIIQKLSYVCFNIFCILFFCFFSFLGIKAEAYNTIEAVIPVSCLEILDSNTHTYEIAIESENDISPQPKSNTLTVKDNGIGEFIIEITEPGTYVYKVYEKPGTNIDITYDDTIYYVTVFVTNTKDNDLIYAISAKIANRNSKSDKVLFKDIISDNAIVSITNMTDITIEETYVTTIVNTTTSNIITTTSLDNNTTITNLIDTFITGDFTPVRLLFVIIGISIIIGLIMMIIKKNERGQ